VDPPKRRIHAIAPLVFSATSMKITATYREECALPDGEIVTVRAIRPEDASEFRRAYQHLSAATRRNRFLFAPPELTENTIRYLTLVDFDRHVAVVATQTTHDMKTEVGLGVARFIRLREDPSVAEAAVTVVDDVQGRGIGRVLLTTLAEAARERGVRAFSGPVLRTNERMLQIMREVGAVIRREDDDSLVYEVPLASEGPPSETSSDHPLRRLLHAAAESVAGFFSLRSKLEP
jgi:GNAT superfamily N-acetyltransferase